MLEVERRERILGLLRRETFAGIRTIAELTGSSETTVRRDLAILEREGVIRRLRGGAELDPSLRSAIEPPREEPFENRLGARIEAKRRIAAYAASMCANGDTIFIDGGSTTFYMVDYLRDLRLTIVTNSFAVAESLVRSSGNTVILQSGIVFPDSLLVLDPLGSDIFEDYHAHLVFMGVGGITAQGAFNNEAQLIRAERSMIRNSERLVVLADSSKIGRTAPLKLCELESIDTLIVDAPSPEFENSLSRSGIRVIGV